MRLDRMRPERPQLQALPLASLALLVFACLSISGMYSAFRGPGMRFAGSVGDVSFDDDTAVRVEVLSEQDALVDGVPVPFAGIASAVSERLAGRSDAGVVLVVSPDATYETMAEAYGAISALPGPPPIAFPARRGPRG
jgi:hypothetical protein